MIIVSCFPKLAISSGDKSTLALFRSLRRSICSKTNKSKNEEIWWPLTSCMFCTRRSFHCLQIRDLTHAYTTATAKTNPSKKFLFLFYFGFSALTFIWNYPVCLSVLKLASAELTLRMRSVPKRNTNN